MGSLTAGTMGNGHSQENSEERGPPSTVIRQKITELDAMLNEPPPPPDDGKWSTGKSTTSGEAYVDIVIGTSALVEVPGMVEQINAIAGQSKHLGCREVVRRLRMGDDGIQANRVLHLAFKKDDGTLVGCMSSTFQPPWTERGCGHWGLLAVHPQHQGKGIASALVHAAEHRLATACTEIQMEYSYSFGDEDSARLCEWYEGRLGFRCANGCEPYDGENQPQGEIGDGEFRMCRKLIPEAAQRAGERRRLEEIRSWLGEQLQQIEAREALEQPMQMGEPTAEGSEESEEDGEDMEDDVETSEQPMQ